MPYDMSLQSANYVEMCWINFACLAKLLFQDLSSFDVRKILSVFYF